MRSAVAELAALLLPAPGGDPLAPLVVAVAVAAWCCAGWLLLVLLAGTAARLPGAAGRAGRVLTGALVPAALRALLPLGCGLAVLTGTAPATADERPVLDWPGAVPAAPAPGRVVVRPGDSLWRLAAADLGPSAPDAAVARAWPAWWAANRAVLGDSPDLIHPGTALIDPTR